MSAATSNSPAKPRPATYFHKACMNCRRRKIRCDSIRPVCGPCRQRPPRSGTPCKYSHPPPGGSSQHEDQDSESFYRPDPPRINLWVPSPSRPPLQSASIPHLDLASENAPELTGPHLDLFFLRFPSRHLFFLDPSKLYSSAMGDGPTPTDHPDALSLELLCVLNLWVRHLGKTEDCKQGDALLSLARRHLSEIAETNDLCGILQNIQAAVLLSLYYLDTARLSEGRQYCAVATSFALTAGLHRLRSPSPNQLKAIPRFAFAGPPLTAVHDATQRKAIDAFWSVVILNNYWVAASGLPSFIPCDVSISTPWPKDPRVVSETNPPKYSPLALLAQASILLERTIACVASHPAHCYPVFSDGLPRFCPLDHRLNTFIKLLDGSRSHAGECSEKSQIALVTYAFAYSAIIRLHAPHITINAYAQSKCISAARALFASADTARVSDWEYFDPILGPLFVSVGQLYAAQLPDAEQERTIRVLQTLTRGHMLGKYD